MPRKVESFSASILSKCRVAVNYNCAATAVTQNFLKSLKIKKGLTL